MRDLRSYPGGNVRKQLLSENYISRKPIYDFIKQHQHEFTGVILDYGCGNVPYKKMFKKCEKYIGLDYDVTATSAGFKGDDGVIYYDGVNIPFEDNSMDNVLCFQVLEHVDDPIQSLTEIKRVLKPDGKLMLTLPAAYPIHMAPYDFRRFTSYGIERMLRQTGYSDIFMTGSTIGKYTLKRLKIKTVPYRIHKLYIVVENLSYLMYYFIHAYVERLFNVIRNIIGKEKHMYEKDTLVFPLDYFVICKKC